jgi:predicted glycosyltransferase involved in capsule biosynthesis
MLQQALSTWLACPEITEVIVVDWSSRTPVAEALAELVGDTRVQVARVVGQRRWIATKSHNLGARIASGDVLLRLDSDYLLGRDFFREHALGHGEFFCGNWHTARVENELHLTGALYVHRRHFLAANGYNERIVTYGYEDDDLFERLEGAGLKRRDFDLDTVHHLPHDDLARTKHQDIFDVYSETERNKTLAHRHPWSAADRMTAWDCRESEDGGTVCVEAAGGGS